MRCFLTGCVLLATTLGACRQAPEPNSKVVLNQESKSDTVPPCRIIESNFPDDCEIVAVALRAPGTLMALQRNGFTVTFKATDYPGGTIVNITPPPKERKQNSSFHAFYHYREIVAEIAPDTSGFPWVYTVELAGNKRIWCGFYPQNILPEDVYYAKMVNLVQNVVERMGPARFKNLKSTRFVYHDELGKGAVRYRLQVVNTNLFSAETGIPNAGGIAGIEIQYEKETGKITTLYLEGPNAIYWPGYPSGKLYQPHGGTVRKILD